MTTGTGLRRSLRPFPDFLANQGSLLCAHLDVEPSHELEQQSSWLGAGLRQVPSITQRPRFPLASCSRRSPYNDFLNAIEANGAAGCRIAGTESLIAVARLRHDLPP